jgi:hypothetical protein
VVLWNAHGEVMHTAASSYAKWLAPDGSFALGYTSSIPFGVPPSPLRFDHNLAVADSVPGSAAYSQHEATAASDDGNTLLVNRFTSGIWESVLYFSAAFGSGNLIPHRADESQYFADVTPDGSLLVGQTYSLSGSQAVTWSFGYGYTTIPGLGTCYLSDAIGVAQRAVGVRVVGHCDDHAYVWDEYGQVRLLADALAQLGVATPANASLHIEDISTDGGTLVGYSRTYDTDTEHAFIVRLGEDYSALP